MNKSLEDQYKIVNGRSEVTHAILTGETRFKKAQKIYSILNNERQLNSAQLLDIGAGSGHIAQAFTNYGCTVESVDLCDLRQVKHGYNFQLYDGTTLPYIDASFDIVITNHVIEHVDSQQDHLDEIYRVLKPGGICYLATPNKFTLMEPHYRLFFLSWPTKALSSFYLKLIKNKVWDIKPLKLSNIQKIAQKRFEIKDISPLILSDPSKYNLDMMPKLHFIFKMIPVSFWKLVSPLLPTMILIMIKKA
ncbi:MAG: class I SAM-dependent methyltransferase [Candidatus Paceibacterota bacterium]